MKKTHYIQTMLIPGIICLFFSICHAQDEQTEADIVSKVAPKVFMDCDFCDLNFIRKEVTFINYVRDSKEADIHVLVTRQYTGGGGKEVAILFIGQKEFEGMNDTLIYITGPDATEEEIDNAGVQTLKIGLMYYIGKTPLGKYINITYDKEAVPMVVKDNWNNWVFEIDIRGWFSGQQSDQSVYLWSSVDARKITSELKIEMDANATYEEEKFKVGDVLSLRRSQSFNTLIVKSLGEHWSAGAFGNVSSSLYLNYKLRYGVFPALEYNLFPYFQSARKQLRFLYRIGYSYNYYNDTTLYNNKIEEGLFKESLVVALELKQKWGSVSAFLKGSHYLHDFSKNRLVLGTRLSWRIFKGLSFNISGTIELIHDQISLKKGSVTDEEILLRQKLLETDYKYRGNVGLTYTFGSIYNNVVNPRFGN